VFTGCFRCLWIYLISCGLRAIARLGSITGSTRRYGLCNRLASRWFYAARVSLRRKRLDTMHHPFCASTVVGSVKAALPGSLPHAPMYLVADNGDNQSAPLPINVPVVDWWVTNAWHSAGVAFPGGKVTLFGKALGYSIRGDGTLDCLPIPPLMSSSPSLVPSPTLAVFLVSSSGVWVPLALQSASCYRITATLPDDAPDGVYSIAINNGLLPEGTFAPGLVEAPQILVNASDAPTWPTLLWQVGVNCSVLRIGDCLAAAGAAGGGTVGVPPGFYRMPPLTMLGLPNNVTLTGLSALPSETTLAWLDEPPNGSQCISNNTYWCACVFTQNAYWDPTAKTSGALRNLTILVASPVKQAVQFVNCIGCEITNAIVNLTLNLTEYPARNRRLGPIVLQPRRTVAHPQCDSRFGLWVLQFQSWIIHGSFLSAVCEGWPHVRHYY